MKSLTIPKILSEKEANDKMVNFQGNFHHSIDAKNRLSLPSRHRDELSMVGSNVLYITIGIDNCLNAFSKDQWDAYSNKLLENSSVETRELQRTFFGNSVRVEIDPQGRFILSEDLKKLAGLGTNVSLVGIGNMIEIWDTDIWKSKNENICTNKEKLLDLYKQSGL